MRTDVPLLVQIPEIVADPCSSSSETVSNCPVGGATCVGNASKVNQHCHESAFYSNLLILSRFWFCFKIIFSHWTNPLFSLVVYTLMISDLISLTITLWPVVLCKSLNTYNDFVLTPKLLSRNWHDFDTLPPYIFEIDICRSMNLNHS